jgi:hypothetical protein
MAMEDERLARPAGRGRPASLTEGRLVVVRDLAQRSGVTNHQGRAFRLHDLTPLHVSEQPGHRLSRRPDHLRDFLVGEPQFQPWLRF